MKITLCYVGLNRLRELQSNIRAASPYVDRTIVIDGKSEDGTLDWLNSSECKNLRVEHEVHKQVRLQYGAHTPNERNLYLRKLDTRPGNWVLVLDSDEFLEEKALRNIRRLALDAEKKDINNIGFKAHDIWTYADGQVYDNRSNYSHHSMFMKTWPGMRYVGDTHAHIVRPGLQNKWVPSIYEYVHRKHELTMWRSDTYLYWTSATPAQNDTEDPTWKKFHELMQKYGYYDWHDLNKVMDAGNIPEEIKDWFIDHRNNDNSQAAAWFVHYFISLHSDQNHGKLRSDRYNKDWDYVLKASNQETTNESRKN